MFRKIVILAAFLALLASLPFTLGVSADSYLDNSDLMPAYKPDDEVQLIQNGAMLSPEWIDSLILGQMRIDTATAGGTFATAVEALDHFAEMGVNGVWINPVYHPGPTDNGYGNNRLLHKQQTLVGRFLHITGKGKRGEVLHDDLLG